MVHLYSQTHVSKFPNMSSILITKYSSSLLQFFCNCCCLFTLSKLYYNFSKDNKPEHRGNPAVPHLIQRKPITKFKVFPGTWNSVFEINTTKWTKTMKQSKRKCMFPVLGLLCFIKHGTQCFLVNKIRILNILERSCDPSER